MMFLMGGTLKRIAGVNVHFPPLKKRRRIPAGVVGCVLLVLLAGCDPSPEDVRQLRTETLEHSAQPLGIGVVWTEDSDNLFMEGIYLAYEEIQAQGGVILKGQTTPRAVELIEITEPPPFVDAGDFKKARNYAQWIARDTARKFVTYPNVMAVIGHEFSSVAIPASLLYRDADIVHLSPSATRMGLTQPRFSNVFRTTLNSDHLSEQLAAFCYYHDYKKLVVFNARAYKYSEEMSDLFVGHVANISDRMEDPEFQVIYHGSFFEAETDLRDMLGKLKTLQFDAIFLPVGPKSLELIITQSYELKIETVFIGDYEFNTRLFLDTRQEEWFKSGMRIIAPITYNPASNLTAAFINKYRERFGHPPDDWAARAYDSMRVLIEGLKRTSSPNPQALANSLRFMPPYLGTTGAFGFEVSGELKNKPLFFHEINQDGFTPLRKAHLPYLFERLKKRRLRLAAEEEEEWLKAQKQKALLDAKQKVRATLQDSSDIYLQTLQGGESTPTQ